MMGIRAMEALLCSLEPHDLLKIYIIEIGMEKTQQKNPLDRMINTRKRGLQQQERQGKYAL